MQEKLILKPKTECNLDNLDYTKLSATQEFGDKLEQFNQIYDVELVATKGARWQPGTYNKLKDWVPNILYPHWKRRKGANSIGKLLQQEAWRYDNFKQSLQKLDSMLYNYRKDGVELYAESDLSEASDKLTEIINLLSTPISGIKVDISPIPYFGRTQRYSPHNYNIDNDIRLFPVLNQDMDIIGSNNQRTYNTITDYETIQEEIIKIENHPGKWYVNIFVSLKDVNIKVTNRDMNIEYGNFPYGDIIVGLTIDLMTLCTNYRRINNKQTMIKYEYIGNGTTVFPYYDAIQHPFIYHHQDNEHRNTIGWFTSYGNGNTCFGDLSKEIYQALCTGNLKMLKTYLKIWSSSYTSGSTSPLNNPQKFHFGKPKEWNDIISSHIATDTSVCQTQLNYGTDKEIFKDTFCTNCALTNNCRTYSKLLFLELDWKTSADKNWRRTFDQICDYFDGDLSKEVLNEIFNDLYFYLEASKEIGTRKVRQIFMLRNAHNYYLAPSIRNKKEWDEFLHEFCKNPMDNLKEMFHRAERAWILEQISHENNDMFHQLMAKTEDMTFQKSCEVLPNRTIEDNHYSWLYAIGSMTNRSDYMTYYNLLNQRKEGLRFGN